MSNATVFGHQYRANSMGIEINAQIPHDMTVEQWAELLSLMEDLILEHHHYVGHADRIEAARLSREGITSRRGKPAKESWEHLT